MVSQLPIHLFLPYRGMEADSQMLKVSLSPHRVLVGVETPRLHSVG
jgi:hypothetical protein